jgi:hypothetical protein
MRDAIEQMINLFEVIELEYGTSFEEWRAFKASEMRCAISSKVFRLPWSKKRPQ